MIILGNQRTDVYSGGDVAAHQQGRQPLGIGLITYTEPFGVYININ